MPSPINGPAKQFSQRTLSDSIMHDTMIDDILMSQKEIPIVHTTMRKSITEGGQTKINQYTMEKTLGRGSFAKVKLASDGSNKYVRVFSLRQLKYATERS